MSSDLPTDAVIEKKWRFARSETSIPTLEALAERFESCTLRTIAALGSQATLANDLSILRRDYDEHERKLEAALEGSEQIKAPTVGERAKKRERLIAGHSTTIDYLDKIGANERIQVRRAADIEGYRVKRGVLRELLKIRELYDTAERAVAGLRR